MEANILYKPIFKPITLKNKLTIKTLIVFQFFFVFFYSGICDLTKIPKTISYFVDVMNIILLIYMLLDRARNKKISNLKLNAVYLSCIGLCLICLSTSFIHSVNPLLVVWAVRNELRFFPFLFAAILYLSFEDIKLVINCLFKLQILNVIISLIQFKFFGYEQDRLGGIFGVTVGCNSLTNVYFCFLMTIAVCYYLRNKMSFIKMALTIVSCLLIGALAELKVIYGEFALIVVFVLILSKKSMKSMTILTTSIIGLFASLLLFEIVFPGWASQMTGISEYLNVGFSTGGGYELSRLGAITDINTVWFHDDPILNIFGYGFGYCEYSAFSFFTSDFSVMYFNYHYTWFSLQKFFLECGYVGLIGYSIVIISMFTWITRKKRIYGDKDGLGSYGQIFCGLMVIYFIYNSTLRTECGYLAYLFLAIPFIYYKSIAQNKKGQGLYARKN